MIDILRFIFNAEQQLSGIKKMINPNADTTPIIPQGKIMIELMNLLKRALPKEDYDYIMQHIMEGAHGHMQFLNSEAIIPVVEMLNYQYRAFLRGEIK